MYCLEGLRRQAARVWDKIDCLLVPTSPTVATIETMLADPVAKNSKFGVYTNFVNLLDLAAISLPEGMRADGLPSGVTYIAPAFTDEALCAWSARWQAHTGLPLGATALTFPGEPDKSNGRRVGAAVC